MLEIYNHIFHPSVLKGVQVHSVFLKFAFATLGGKIYKDPSQHFHLTWWHCYILGKALRKKISFSVVVAWITNLLPNYSHSILSKWETEVFNYVTVIVLYWNVRFKDVKLSLVLTRNFSFCIWSHPSLALIHWTIWEKYQCATLCCGYWVILPLCGIIQILCRF